MATFSLDLRTRILAAYDAGEGTRETVAARFRVSLGMVKKLLQQRRRTGDLAAGLPRDALIPWRRGTTTRAAKR